MSEINDNPIQTNEDIEVQLFLEALYLKYGHDFRDYSRAHIKRRIIKRKEMDKFNSIGDMIMNLLEDKLLLYKILADFSINMTEMFRDPVFFQKLKNEILPILNTYPQIRIWAAGCASGEEVYSLAIILKELGMYSKTTIYATDFNDNILNHAKEGLYPLHLVKDYTKNYQTFSGEASLSDYYVATDSFAKIADDLKENIVFANHNLVTDSSFTDVHLVLCRNVMIYFDKSLKNRTVKLFYESLNTGCFLCLGMKENLLSTNYSDKFLTVCENERIYKKISI